MADEFLCRLLTRMQFQLTKWSNISAYSELSMYTSHCNRICRSCCWQESWSAHCYSSPFQVHAWGGLHWQQLPLNIYDRLLHYGICSVQIWGLPHFGSCSYYLQTYLMLCQLACPSSWVCIAWHNSSPLWSWGWQTPSQMCSIPPYSGTWSTT